MVGLGLITQNNIDTSPSCFNLLRTNTPECLHVSPYLFYFYFISFALNTETLNKINNK